MEPLLPSGWVAGVDEAGRGPIAGPVVAACVVLPSDHAIEGIADSKCLTTARRQRLFTLIRDRAVALGIGLASPAEIDRLNILQASLLAMRRAVQRLPFRPALLLIDGNHCLPNYPFPQRAIVDGDATSEVIAAASILAKVVRDRLMEDYDRLYPLYGFARHKGYATPAHLHLLRHHGVSPLHRRSFAPVAELLGLASEEE